MAPGEQSDAELVRLAREGDLDAFAGIVQRHEQRLRLVLLRILDDTRDVEESVQDAFVQAWRNLDGYRGDAALFTWLYRIGVNSALARARRRAPVTVDLSVVEGQASSSADSVLRDVAGLSNQEVAAALGVSLAAAKSRIHRGRLQLRDRLEGLGEP